MLEPVKVAVSVAIPDVDVPVVKLGEVEGEVKVEVRKYNNIKLKYYFIYENSYLKVRITFTVIKYL